VIHTAIDGIVMHFIWMDMMVIAIFMDVIIVMDCSQTV
jgi:hypothetical protein